MDANPNAPALHEADMAFVVPSVSNPDYVNQLVRICESQHVSLVIPLNDLELPVMSRARASFEAVGALPVVSSPHVIDICFDKWRTVQFLQDIGISAPKSYLTLEDARQALRAGEVEFPLIVKPRWGSASIGVEAVQDLDELELALQFGCKKLHRTILRDASAAGSGENLLIQELLTGQEYGLDVVNDLHGNYVCTFAKMKLGMRAGETDRATVVRHPALESLGRRLGQALGHIGNLDCDVFLTEKGPYVLELNPRFGGGYPFSHAAGANLPKALLAWRQGLTAESTWFSIRHGLVVAKCDRLLCWPSDHTSDCPPKD